MAGVHNLITTPFSNDDSPLFGKGYLPHCQMMSFTKIFIKIIELVQNVECIL